MFEWLKTASGAYNLTLIVAVVAWLISGAGIFAGFHLNKTRAIEAQHRTAKAESESAAIGEKLTTTTLERSVWKASSKNWPSRASVTARSTP